LPGHAWSGRAWCGGGGGGVVGRGRAVAPRRDHDRPQVPGTCRVSGPEGHKYQGLAKALAGSSFARSSLVRSSLVRSGGAGRGGAWPGRLRLRHDHDRPQVPGTCRVSGPEGHKFRGLVEFWARKATSTRDLRWPWPGQAWPWPWPGRALPGRAWSGRAWSGRAWSWRAGRRGGPGRLRLAVAMIAGSPGLLPAESRGRQVHVLLQSRTGLPIVPRQTP
jgi:hypothetical protein